MPRKSTDWDVRTNMSATRGSQGTLFQGGTKYSSDARFPRGYTPERLREVADHVIEPQIKFYTDARGRQEITGVDSVHARSFVARGDVHVDKSPVRNMVDTIARSTVPVEHLKGVQFSSYHGLVPPGHEGMPMPDGSAALGVYTRPGHGHLHPANAKGPAIRVIPSATQGETVIHEIGHHVSRTVADNSFSNYGNSAQQGREEGFADNYAQEHFRDRRGQKTEVGTYAGGQRSDKRNEMFYQSYHQQRGATDPQRAHLYAPAGGQRPGLPSDPQEHVFGQQPLVNKIQDRPSDEDLLQHHLGKKPLKYTYSAEVNMEAHPDYKSPQFGS